MARRRAAARETVVRAGVVDVFVVHPTSRGWRHLALRRARGVRCPGTWEAVHGRIERGETPPDAARREVREETGLAVERLYSLTVNPFFLTATGTVELAVAFVAVVASSAVTLGDEHDAFEWLSRAAARRRYHWPRERESLDHIAVLFKGGDAGKAEDVLRADGRRRTADGRRQTADGGRRTAEDEGSPELPCRQPSSVSLLASAF